MPNENDIKIFIAYSRKDADILEKLHTNLRVLERTQNVQVWYDGEIEIGSDWEKSIKDNLHSADIILLLISENFIASDYCYNDEMKQALNLHKEGKVKAIPIIAKECLWQDTLFACLQALPQNGKPLTNKDWSTPNRPYLEVVKELKKMVLQLQKERQAKIISPQKQQSQKSFLSTHEKVTPAKSKSFFLKNRNQLRNVFGVIGIAIISIFAIPKLISGDENSKESIFQDEYSESVKKEYNKYMNLGQGELEKTTKEGYKNAKIYFESAQRLGKDFKNKPEAPNFGIEICIQALERLKQESEDNSKKNKPEAEIINGKLIDNRNGQSYNIVSMNDGNVWMAENLNIKTDNSYCYNNKSENCKKYGRLYTWEAALKACPKGWHLPSGREWNNLVERGGKLAYQNLTRAKFKALLGGQLYNDNFYYIDEVGCYWSIVKKDNSLEPWVYLFDTSKILDEHGASYNAISCRCIKD